MVVLEVKQFDVLLGTDKHGKQTTWDLSVERSELFSEIVIKYGYANLIETRRRINSGKNVGKKNATDHFTQALVEANSKWTKRKDTSIKDVTSVYLPMLAQDFNKQKKKIKYPCLVQNKIDGYRAVYNTTTKQITTRQGKDFLVVKESGELYKELLSLPDGLILDGELYTNKFDFEVLGVLRKTNLLNGEDKEKLAKIEYHIYDIIDLRLTFEERNKVVQDLLKAKYKKLVYVDTYMVNSENEIKEYHTKFLEEGYEGTMIRNKDSLYTVKSRSSDLLKYKDFMDDEFEIVNFSSEKDTSGQDENLIVWIVAVPSKIKETEEENNIMCKVRPKGTKTERQELYKKCLDDFSQFKGHKLWTQFFSYTADGSLRFPTTSRNSYTEYIRDEIL